MRLYRLLTPDSRSFSSANSYILSQTALKSKLEQLKQQLERQHKTTTQEPLALEPTPVITAKQAIIGNLKQIKVSPDKTTWFSKPAKDHENLCYGWIRLNGSKAQQIIMIDIDEDKCDLELVEKVRAAIKPHYTIYHPCKNSVQVGYIINKPIFKNSALFKQFERIRALLNKAFNGDLNNINTNGKSPYCWSWDFNRNDDQPSYSLDNLEKLVKNWLGIEEQKQQKEPVSVVDLTPNPKGKNENYQFDPNSTNCQNFEDLRFKGYAWAKEFKTAIENKEELKKRLFVFLKSQANPENYGHQTESEINSTVKSITNFCVDEYNGNGKFAKTNATVKRKIKNKLEYIKANVSNVKAPLSEEEKAKLAKELNCSVKTIRKYLAQIRKGD
ncbi:hypothetical protein [Lonepinella sp. BR2357]|uniref:hypothetical protein n=1 Tax=Lonepinella sp. BR2357 TaxID=3434549 RepID=UPI003F6DE29B